MLGVDPATHTGVVRIEGHESIGKCINFPNQKGWERLQSIAIAFNRTLDIWKPDVIVIEHYAYANRFSLVDLVEIGTVIRLCLHARDMEWWECPPTSLKKWVTGKGNAKKEDMAHHVFERWQYKSPSDDITDAYALAMLGKAVLSGEQIKGVFKAK